MSDPAALMVLIDASAPFLAGVAVQVVAAIVVAVVGSLAAIWVGVRLGSAGRWLRWAILHEQRMRILRGKVAVADERQAAIAWLVRRPHTAHMRQASDPCGWCPVTAAEGAIENATRDDCTCPRHCGVTWCGKSVTA